MPSCPICHKEITESKAFPFCSARCKNLDLGNWASEKYRVACVEEERNTSNPSRLATDLAKSKGTSEE